MSVDGAVSNPPIKAMVRQVEVDAAREALIEHAFEHMLDAPTLDNQREWYAVMVYHIRQRSPERVSRMEIERGLAR